MHCHMILSIYMQSRTPWRHMERRKGIQVREVVGCFAVDWVQAISRCRYGKSGVRNNIVLATSQCKSCVQYEYTTYRLSVVNALAMVFPATVTDAAGDHK